MALIPKPNVTIRWAEGGNQLEPSSEVQELGFVVEKPPYEVVNWLHNKHDTAVAYLYQEGFADWDIETEYSNTSYVKYDGVVYRAKLQNTGKQPDTNPDNWDIAFANYQDYLDLYQDLQDTKNVAGHADNLVYKDAPVMTNKAIGTSFSVDSGFGTNNGYQFNNHSRDGLFHNGTNPVVLNDGTTVASFSGNISNPSPKDVVTFDMLLNYTRQPVGSLYFTSNSVNPSVELGYGTWERYAEGKAIVGFSSKPEDPTWTRVPLGSFGSYTHKLTQSELPITNVEFPADDQLILSYGLSRSTTRPQSPYDAASSTAASFQSGWAKTSSFGDDQPHNNVQPSIVIYVWRRVS